MVRPRKKIYKRPSSHVVGIVILMVLLSVPTTVVLTAGVKDRPTTESRGAVEILGDPTNLGPSVNSSANEFDPSISADELELYFNSYRPGGLGKADLWVTKRKTKADPWGTPVNLGPTVNSSAPDNAPSISADGLSLYFSSGRSGGYGGRDLWVTMRKAKSDPWIKPTNLGPTVNSQYDEHGPYISTDGLSLYFSEYPDESERPGGSGKSDIWVTTRKTKADPWGKPVSLGPVVNSPTWDESPSISPDGLSLYFNSYRAGVLGTGEDSDIWVTKRKTTSDSWGTPVNLGPSINSTNWEANPDISRDGSTLYFVCIRPDGSGATDLWQVSIAAKQEQGKGIEGLWDMVKYRWGNMEEFNYCKAENIRNLKVMQGGIYSVVRYNSETGEVLRTHGGTYTFDGQNLNSETTFASESMKGNIGKKSNYKIDLRGDTFFQSGLLAGNMKLEEEWIRVK